MKTLMLAITMTALPLAIAPATAATSAQEATATAPAPAPAKAAKFNLDTPIEQIVADPKGKEALDTLAPGLTTHASYDLFKGMSINQLKEFAGDQLTPEVLEKAEKALAAVE